MRATHKKTQFKFNGEVISLQPGQFVTGRFEGAKDCKMSPSTFRNQISKLKAGGNLDSKSDNRKSIITIVNWASYQADQIKEDSTLAENRTQTRRKNKLIELAKSLIESVNKETSFYSILNKYSVSLGEEKTMTILNGCLNRENKFPNENRLAAYLETCVKNPDLRGKKRSGQITESLPELTGKEPQWL